MERPKYLFRAEFGSGRKSASAARRMVRTALLFWDLAQMGDDVEQVTAELVANALPGGTYVVMLSREITTNSIHLAVMDSRAGTPHPKEAGDKDEGGRGLLIVDALATEWGYSENVVWARFKCSPSV